MKLDRQILKTTFRNLLLVAVYIFGVSQLLNHGEAIFSEVDNQTLAPFAFLLLFSLSAAIVGSLILGHGIILYLANKKSDAINSIAYSIGWMFIITLFIFVLLAII